MYTMQFLTLTSSQVVKKLEEYKTLFKEKDTDDNWKKKDRALYELRLAVESFENADTYERDASREEIFVKGVRDLLPNLLGTLLSLRTSLAMECLLLIEAVSKHFGGHRIGLHLLELTLSGLLKCSSSRRKLTVTKCFEVTKVFLKNVGFQARLFQMLYKGMDDKNPDLRKHIAAFIGVIIETYGPRKMINPEEKPEVHVALHSCFYKKGLTDASPTVREECRKTFVIYSCLWPEKADHILSSLDSTPQRQLKKYMSKPGIAALVVKRKEELHLKTLENSSARASKHATPTTSSSSTIEKLAVSSSSQNANSSNDPESSCPPVSDTKSEVPLSSNNTKNPLKRAATSSSLMLPPSKRNRVNDSSSQDSNSSNTSETSCSPVSATEVKAPLSSNNTKNPLKRASSSSTLSLPSAKRNRVMGPSKIPVLRTAISSNGKPLTVRQQELARACALPKSLTRGSLPTASSNSEDCKDFIKTEDASFIKTEDSSPIKQEDVSNSSSSNSDNSANNPPDSPEGPLLESISAMDLPDLQKMTPELKLEELTTPELQTMTPELKIEELTPTNSTAIPSSTTLPTTQPLANTASNQAIEEVIKSEVSLPVEGAVAKPSDYLTTADGDIEDEVYIKMEDEDEIVEHHQQIPKVADAPNLLQEDQKIDVASLALDTNAHQVPQPLLPHTLHRDDVLQRVLNAINSPSNLPKAEDFASFLTRIVRRGEL